MNVRQAMRCATAVSFALVFSTAYAAGENKPATDTSANTPTEMTGKQKATAIGATTGAVAGAVVGGPVGAVVGGVAGGVVGHQGTDAQGRVTPSTPSSNSGDGTRFETRNWRSTARAITPGRPTASLARTRRTRIRRFQADKGLAADRHARQRDDERAGRQVSNALIDQRISRRIIGIVPVIRRFRYSHSIVAGGLLEMS